MRALLDELDQIDGDGTPTLRPVPVESKPQCNLKGILLDRHVFLGGWICKRCGARKSLTPGVNAR